MPAASAADVNTAVRRAQAAQPGRERLGLDGQAACFTALRQQLVAAVRSWLDAIDCGDPVRAMRTDVDICLGYLDAYPSMVYGV